MTYLSFLKITVLNNEKVSEYDLVCFPYPKNKLDSVII